MSGQNLLSSCQYKYGGVLTCLPAGTVAIGIKVETKEGEGTEFIIIL